MLLSTLEAAAAVPAGRGAAQVSRHTGGSSEGRGSAERTLCKGVEGARDLLPSHGGHRSAPQHLLDTCPSAGVVRLLWDTKSGSERSRGWAQTRSSP